MTMRKRWIAPVWLALWTLALSATVATQALAQAPGVDQAAVQKLKAMTDFSTACSSSA
jgi:hypothetical protein